MLVLQVPQDLRPPLPGVLPSFVIQADIFYEFMQKIGVDKKPVEGEKIEIPIHVVLSLLRPDELEKLKRYMASYENAPGS